MPPAFIKPYEQAPLMLLILHRMWIDGKTFRWTKEEKVVPQIAAA